jgi:type IX secretion system PorP/SprF family membrane protein
MGKKGFAGLFFLFVSVAFSQSLDLPPDFRQHNLTEYNANLFSPVLSLSQEQQQRLALWTRWQWQTIDADPTTLYLSYLRRESNMAFGGGFFQHNSGLFQQTGGVLNFAYRVPVGEGFGIAFGLNLFGYQQELADDRLNPSEPILPIERTVNDFILQMAPAVEVSIERFALGVVAENLFDYNFTESQAVTESDQKTITLMGRYAFQVAENAAGQVTTLEPRAYYRRIPGFDNQVGLNALWAAPAYWAQAGYNSYYGVSAGAGVRLFQKVSLGALLEFGSDESPLDSDTSFEVVMAFSFGGKKPEPPQEPAEELIVEQEAGEEEARVAEQIEAQEQAIRQAAQRRDSLDARTRAQDLVLQQRRDSIRQMQEAALALRRSEDSLRQEAEAALALQRRKDSLDRAAAALAGREAVVVPEKGEKYQEVSREEGLEPGFYLITNVFSTKKYYDLFMERLKGRGLEPKSFYRSANRFNYVYLERYETIEDARRARDSKFNGRYQGELWIFRVR